MPRFLWLLFVCALTTQPCSSDDQDCADFTDYFDSNDAVGRLTFFRNSTLLNRNPPIYCLAPKTVIAFNGGFSQNNEYEMSILSQKTWYDAFNGTTQQLKLSDALNAEVSMTYEIGILVRPALSTHQFVPSRSHHSRCDALSLWHRVGGSTRALVISPIDSRALRITARYAHHMHSAAHTSQG